MARRAAKISWRGTVVAVQPRIRLNRSFDQRTHSYQGYVVRVDGTIGDEDRTFQIAIGKAGHEKHQLRLGDELEGSGVKVLDPRTETAELYRISRLKVLARGPGDASAGPPFGGVPPTLPIYRARGHRRLAAQTFAAKCGSCIWACEMPVEMTIDHWNPQKKRYRRETFCYGPKSCSLYAAGPRRTVPGRRGMKYEEADSVDEEATAHRGLDE